MRNAIEEEDEQHNSGNILFGEGSLFFTGNDDTLAWPWPPFGQPSPSITKAPGDLWLTSARHSLELSQEIVFARQEVAPNRCLDPPSPSEIHCASLVYMMQHWF